MNTVSQKPRTIRKVTHRDKTGTPKKAADIRTHHLAERIKAREPRPCDSIDCPWPNHIGHSRHGIIDGGAQYIRVTGRESRRMGGKHIPITKDYHPDCVPDMDRPLVRLLIGYRWIAETCTDGDRPTSKRKFTSDRAWSMWVDKEYPSYRRYFEVADNNGFQVGTGYEWSRLVRYTGRST